MNRVVRLRLRATRILRNEAVHQIEHDFPGDERVGINLGETFRAKTRTLRKATPVVDIGNGHVVKAAGDPVCFAAAHYRNIDDLRDFTRDDL